jgi:hypothetical protein
MFANSWIKEDFPAPIGPSRSTGWHWLKAKTTASIFFFTVGVSTSDFLREETNLECPQSQKVTNPKISNDHVPHIICELHSKVELYIPLKFKIWTRMA